MSDFNIRKRIFSRAGLLNNVRNTCFPLMEAISDKRFDIEEGYGATDNKSRVVKVPLDESDRSRRVRVHEMAHAVISPNEFIRPENIHRMAMQRAEDLRCNAWNEDIGHVSELNSRLTKDSVIKKHVTEPIIADPELGRLHAASSAMATKGSKDYDKVIKGIENADPEFAELVEKFVDARWEVAKRHAKKKPAEERRDFAGGFDESIVNAEMLMELVETNEMPQDAYNDGEEGEPEDGDESDGEGEGDGSEDNDNADPSEGKVGKGKYKDRARGKMIKDRERVDDSAFGWDAREADEEADMEGYEDGEEKDKDIEDHLRDMSKIIHPGDGEPGSMKIIEVTRQFRLPGSMEGRKRRPVDIGRVPQFMNRYASDRQIFTEQGKRPGGCSVLIDDSGSMSLSMDEIEQILYLMPAATIAAYCGYSNTGSLVLIAKNGRRISQEEYYKHKAGGSNIVDIPALEWLCKQQGPRYWISDGYITGVGDRGLKTHYYDYVKALCRKYKIYRIPCVSEARRGRHNSYGHKHRYSLEGVVSGGKRRRKVHHQGHMIGQLHV